MDIPKPLSRESISLSYGQEAVENPPSLGLRYGWPERFSRMFKQMTEPEKSLSAQKVQESQEETQSRPIRAGKDEYIPEEKSLPGFFGLHRPVVLFRHRLDVGKPGPCWGQRALRAICLFCY